MAQNRFQKVWKNINLTWEEILERLGRTVRTNETVGQFKNMTKTEQDNIKDVGGFVGGYLKEGKRKNGFVAKRDIITLDADFAKPDFVESIKLFADYTYCIYSTHKHTEDTQRLRLVIPLSRSVSCDEYEAIARKVAENIGIEQFDDTTYQAHRLMYWPSTSIDGQFVFEHEESKALDVESYLNLYDDWKDISAWPTSDRTNKVRANILKKQENPTVKKGTVGVFCRTYSIQEAIDEFLSDEYSECTASDRYTYKKGTSSAGLVIYEDLFAYSNHATDPASGKLCNAFDLVRIHKFGVLDEDAKDGTPANRMPSYKAMVDFAMKDKRVLAKSYNERVVEARKEFLTDAQEEANNSWALDLQVDERNNYLNTINNIVLILNNDELIKGKIGFNEFTYRYTVIKSLPWDGDYPRDWSDTDTSNLRHYLERVYTIKGKDNINDAITIVMQQNKFHPVRDYLQTIKWDGVKRAETVLCDYLGAEESEYVKFVTRKTLVAAVARVFNPGIKFDNVLTLVGPQGCGKSQIIKRLARNWLSDSLTTVQGKEAFEQIQGFWIIEMPELSALRKAEVEAIKAFTAKAEDSYRAPYGRYSSTRKRQCIFIGTTNRYEFLHDPTGNRRFWPVDVHPQRACKNMWEDLTEDVVEQIWAEVVVMYDNDEQIYADAPELLEVIKKEQEKHFDADPMTESVIGYLNMKLPENWDKMSIFDRRSYVAGEDFKSENDGTVERTKVCAMEIWCELYGKDKGDCRPSDSRSIRDIIMRTGEWEPLKTNARFGINYGTQKGFVKKGVN